MTKRTPPPAAVDMARNMTIAAIADIRWRTGMTPTEMLKAVAFAEGAARHIFKGDLKSTPEAFDRILAESRDAGQVWAEATATMDPRLTGQAQGSA